MFYNKTLGARIGWGFASLLIITMLLGAVSVWSMRSVEAESHMLSEEYAPEVDIANNVERHVLETSLAVRSYGFTFEKKYLDLARTNLSAVKKHIGECKDLADRATHLVKLKASVQPLSAHAAEFEDLINQTEKAEAVIERCRAALDKDAKVFVDSCNAYLKAQEEHMKKDIKEDVSDEKKLERLHKIDLIVHIIEAGDACRLLVWKSQALRDPKLYAESEPLFAAIDKHFEETEKITRIEADQKMLKQASDAAHHYKAAMTELRDAYLSMQEIGRKRAAASESLTLAARELSLAGIKHTREIAEHASHELATATTVNLIGLALAFAVGITVAFMVTRSITSTLKAIIDNLRGSSAQVDAASAQVASSSQQLAAGATQQASSLEETSASLEEMASVTRQNADNAQQASTLAAGAKESAEGGRDAMLRMSAAIEQIKTSSDQTAKIVKTIDEIAFQTNLLALNAAVEAARAGDAGKGFAVVAEEVRNLAQRSAEAARNTAALIEQSQKSSDNGVKVSSEVTTILHKIVEAVQKLAQLNGEVSGACQEQSRGIDQINTAVSEVDKVTQSNAANAEESASAAEELSAQSRELSDMVSKLMQLVGGQASLAAIAPVVPSPAKKVEHKLERPNVMNSAKPMKEAIQKKIAPKSAARAIPLSAEDF